LHPSIPIEARGCWPYRPSAIQVDP
jgi:hypothetical protein